MAKHQRILIGLLGELGLLAIVLWGVPAILEHRRNQARAALYAALRPVSLSNCTMRRFGHAHDGGYLMCANLLDQVQSAYSYGLEGRDEWGCDISRAYHLAVHEYDCFNSQRPRCAGAGSSELVFHDECIGAAKTDDRGRVFDTLAHQIGKNRDTGKRLVVKMDVEGAEWDAWLETAESLLESIDQLAVEFHQVDEPKFLKVIEKLKRTFYIVNVHFNNSSCFLVRNPFPAWAYEVLLVNRRLGVLAVPPAHPTVPHPLDALNNVQVPDCQGDW